MMTATHMLLGMLLGYILGFIQPDIAPYLLIIGFIGGMLPDIDIAFKHKRSLHFPFYYSLIVAITLTSTIFFSSVEAVMAFTFFGAATLHCLTDVFAGSLETALGRQENEKTVYLHPENRWINSVNLIRFPGAPEDLMLSLLIGVPLLIVIQGPLEWLTAATLALGTAYSVMRFRAYRRLQRRKKAPTIKELFEEARGTRGS